jgi:hypothetical protein
LTHLINLSLIQGRVHCSLKKAIITPVFKSGDREDPNNFRPISVLSAFSKVFERVAANKMIEYLDARGYISNNQFGFRRGFSCELPLLLASDYITEALDQGEHVIGVFLDLKKRLIRSTTIFYCPN